MRVISCYIANRFPSRCALASLLLAGVGCAEEPPRFLIVNNTAIIVGDTTRIPGDDLDSNVVADGFYDRSPRVLQKIDPEYPTFALQHKLSGTVRIKAFVSKEGTVKWAKVLQSTDSTFSIAALSSTMVWLFEAASMNGRPVGVWVGLTFRFRILDGAKAYVQSNLTG